jgi:hypothetical protein
MGVDLMAITHQPAAPVNWNQELDGARMLIKSGLLPQGLKSPEAALFVILTGRDLGLSPVQSLRSIHVIQGKIEVAADMQLGLFHRGGGKSHWKELSNERAVLELHAPWLTEPHVETFGMEDAKRAGLGGDNWRKYPKAMLRSRAITAGLKSIGFDPTAGMYAPGEIGGGEVVFEGEVVAVEDVAGKDSAPQAAGSPTPTDVPATADTTSTSGADPLDASLDEMLGMVDADTAIKARQSLDAGRDKRKVLARLTEIALTTPAKGATT